MARIFGLFEAGGKRKLTISCLSVPSLSLACTLLLAAAPAQALDLSQITNSDATTGLKAALEKGTQVAVQQLGKQDGFFGNDRFKIPLPDSLKKIEGGMRMIGMGKDADDLVLRMNRAAEAAVPEAKTLFVDAVKQMSVQDAKGILTGGKDSATQYFRGKTAAPLAQKFQPIVKQAMAKVKLAEIYDKYASQGAKLGLIKKEDVNLEGYITGKALDGLYLAVADEEAKIRDNPAQAASSIISKVFGALGK